MDKQTFLQILENPHQVALYEQEVKQLTSKHPYCQIVHFLDAKIAYAHNAAQTEKKVQIAATYATDRNQLRKLLKKTTPTKPQIGYTPLATTWTVSSVYEEIAKISTQSPSANQPAPITPSSNTNTNVEAFSSTYYPVTPKKEDGQATFTNVATELQTTTDKPATDILPDELRKNLEQMQLNKKRFLESLKEIDKEQTAASAPNKQTTENKKILPQQNQIRQIKQVELIERFIQHKPSITKPENIATNDEPITDLAEVSIQKINVASENLAIILEKQGKFERAIEYYRQLQLKNPEKSDYFAAKILALQEKLK